VYNGSVRGFGVNGVDLGNVVLAEIHSLVVSGNGGVGIYAGDNVTVRDCASRENGGDNFRTAAHAVISHCSAVLSTNGHGFSVTEDCELSHCVSDSNRRGYSATDGFSITSCVARRNKDYGIYAENSAVIINCTASGQFIQNQSGATGIRVGNDGMVSGCTSSRNAGDGIQVISYSQVIHNTVSENGFLTGAQANGIHILGVNNRVDSNHVTRHLGIGILTDQQSNAQNFIVRNTFANNATAILSSGSDQYIGITTQNPFDPNPSAWANFR
jgi:hypothetical protein